MKVYILISFNSWEGAKVISVYRFFAPAKKALKRKQENRHLTYYSPEYNLFTRTIKDE